MSACWVAVALTEVRCTAGLQLSRQHTHNELMRTMLQLSAKQKNKSPVTCAAARVEGGAAGPLQEFTVAPKNRPAPHQQLL
jgi:hypothetical protein